MTFDPLTLAAIAGMAAVTFLTRIAGYWLVRRTTLGPRAQAALEAVPGAILAALITPMVLATGTAEFLAALVTIALASRFPTLVAVIGGVATVVVLRTLIGS